MGYWYVIATIQTFAEQSEYNPVEHYSLKKDRTIATTFRYQKNNANGEPCELTAIGFIKDPSTNAVWGTQFIWPIEADYRIIKSDTNYEITMVGRIKRDYYSDHCPRQRLQVGQSDPGSISHLTI